MKTPKRKDLSTWLAESTCQQLAAAFDANAPYSGAAIQELIQRADRARCRLLIDGVNAGRSINEVDRESHKRIASGVRDLVRQALSGALDKTVASLVL